MAAAVAALAALTSGAEAETRVALIVGNAAYSKGDLRLANPANDADAMQRALAAAGFETLIRKNATRLDLYRAVDELGSRLRKDRRSVGLFYYAGHGMQVDGSNYLIPVDADIQSVPDLEANAFDMSRLLRALEDAGNDMNIVILDACRNNPLPKTRGTERGLARMNAPSGTFIAYAAAPGQTAQDGRLGANGVFTGELVRAMAEPGVPLEQMYKRVISAVKGDTRGGQQPWSESSIQGDFYFHAGAGAAAGARPVDAAQIELSYWESIRDSRNAADFRAYLQRYPHGAFAGIAANRLSSDSRRRSGGAASGVPVAPAQDRRCSAILEKVQIGDVLGEEDRAYLSAHCR